MVVRTNLLVTGPPGSGKTTLITRVAEAYAGRPFGGFYTEEIREEGRRVGFALVGFEGTRGLLAHSRIGGPCRVGKYGVDVEGFEAFLGAIRPDAPEHAFIVIDEIGRMEWYSPRFRTTIGTLLDAERPLFATIALRGPAEIEAIKARDDVLLRTLGRENRDRMLPTVCRDLEAMLGETCVPAPIRTARLRARTRRRA
ncbi:MAG: nucleoside-triphosphatase [Methanomicrobiaceae archaeon]|nr:nucleoside-triphosphatase [Methanomicrobiaceae archaeon]